MAKVPAMQDPAAQSPDPAAQAGSDQDQDESSTPIVVIEVSVNSDGSITVSQESGQQEGAEESGSGEDGGSDGGATPVKNSSEAASLVKQYIDAATQTTDQQQAQAKNEQAAGYSQG